MINQKILHHFSNQSEAKLKPIVTCSHAFSRHWHQLHVFALSSVWFIGLSAFFVIGQSNCFGLEFTTLIWKLPYISYLITNF